MVRLSVNVNKVATLRNSRGGAVPSVVDAVRTCLDAGATGITVHPRADARHITTRDTEELAALLEPLRETVEYNIEGDPRPDLMDRVASLRPHQCTLVPVQPGEITSQAGWPPGALREQLSPVIARLRGAGIRVSLFVDAEPAAVAWAAELGADRIELYTEPFARAFERSREHGRESFARRSGASSDSKAATRSSTVGSWSIVASSRRNTSISSAGSNTLSRSIAMSARSWSSAASAPWSSTRHASASSGWNRAPCSAS